MRTPPDGPSLTGKSDDIADNLKLCRPNETMSGGAFGDGNRRNQLQHAWSAHTVSKLDPIVEYGYTQMQGIAGKFSENPVDVL